MAVKASYVILVLLLAAVILNSFFINAKVEEIYNISKEADGGELSLLSEKFTKIKECYQKNELIISLSVSHNDLTEIEFMLSEIEGAILAGDKEAAIIAKSRFENALLHLGRLSAFNFESIF